MTIYSDIEESPDVPRQQSIYKLVVDADDQIALSEYEPLPKDEEGYYSEAALEDRLIEILGS